MKITKISLIDGGLTGLKVTYEGFRIKNERSIPYERIETINIPIPPELSVLIEKSKIFLLWLTNHWEKKFDKYLQQHTLQDQEMPQGDAGIDLRRAIFLMDNLDILSITTSGSSILISGKMESLVGGKFAMSTPLINEDYGFHMFEDMVLVVKSIFMKVKQFIESDKLMTMEPRDYLIQKAKMDAEAVSDMSADDAKAMMIQKLEESGCIVLKPEDHEVSEKTEDPKAEKQVEEKPEKDKKPTGKKKKDLLPATPGV